MFFNSYYWLNKDVKTLILLKHVNRASKTVHPNLRKNTIENNSHENCVM